MEEDISNLIVTAVPVDGVTPLRARTSANTVMT